MRLVSLGSIKLPNHSIRLMATVLEESGHPTDKAFKTAGVSRALMADPAGEVTGLQEFEFQRAFFELTRCEPALWVDLGSRYRLLSHAPEYYYLMMVTSATLQEAIETGLRFDGLYYTLARGEGLYVRSQLVGIHICPEEIPADLRRFNTLRDLATNCTVFSELWGGPFPFDRVELPLSQDDERFVQPLLPAVPVTYDAAECVWHWSVRLDERRAPQADAVLHDFYARKCESAVGAASEPTDVLTHLAKLLGEKEGPLRLSDAARRLGLSARTLQRRLEGRGVNFRELAASARYRVACRLLAETKTPISRIALDVGYESLSSFNHAFKRHAGMNPSSYRRGIVSAR